MIISKRSLCCGVLTTLLPWALPAQSTPLSAAERSALVSQALQARIRLLGSHLAVDPCSVAAATGDTAFMTHMDERVRHLLLELPYAPGCKRPSGNPALSFVEVASVRVDTAGPLVQLLVHGGDMVMQLQEYRVRGRRWRIHIEEPPPRGTRVQGLERLATTPELQAQRLRVLTTALRALPMRREIDRVILEEELRDQAVLDAAALLELRRVVPELRWFTTVADARRYCDATGRSCGRVDLVSFRLADEDWHVTLSDSDLNGCGGQEYEITVRASADGEVVRSVAIGTSRRCER